MRFPVLGNMRGFSHFLFWMLKYQSLRIVCPKKGFAFDQQWNKSLWFDV